MERSQIGSKSVRQKCRDMVDREVLDVSHPGPNITWLDEFNDLVERLKISKHVSVVFLAGYDVPGQLVSVR
nr:hypothetical protein CFP56_24448 [Quercus suber]